jgi:AAA15 family ATPase/GTPase
MAYHFSSIGLSDQFASYLINDAEPDQLEKLSQINIFIGANNSGKSRFMRELSKLNATPFQRTGINLKDLAKAFDEFKNYIADELNNFSYTQPQTQIESYGNLDAEHINLKTYIPAAYSSEYFQSDKKLEDLKKLLTALRDNPIRPHSYRGDPTGAIQALKDKLRSDDGEKFINLLDKYIFEPVSFKKYYLPTLRSLNDFDSYQNDPNQDIFALRTRQVYGYEDEHGVDIFTGQILYERVRSMLLGDLEDRKRMHDYETFLSIKLFNGQEVVIIPKEKDDVVNVRIGGEERPIHQLGDGIQSLIILTFPLFECENGMFFIEEPELNMHPGMQRKFMEAIQSRPQHQYFITTHSNHLLDLTINDDNISVYTFRSNPGDPESKQEVHLVTYGDRNVLELIGAQNTSLFLANKTVWVEGITDRLYISKYLELYISHYKLAPLREDIDYTFVEYGGNNITHWSFLDSIDPTINVERLCGKLVLIADRDKNRKEARAAELRAKLGDRYYLLPCNEIENTLSLKDFERVIKSYEGGFTMPSGINNNKRRSKQIGLFIEEDIFGANGLTISRPGGYKDDSGTIKQKLAFCRRAINGMTPEDMSTDAINLAKAVYGFLSDN